MNCTQEHDDVRSIELFDDLNLVGNINEYINGNGKSNGIKPTERYTSFDYCYNYFQSFKDKNDTLSLANDYNIINSCYHIGFYLASWGMLRGASYLLQKSIKFYEPLIKAIAKSDHAYWCIDINNYTDKNISLLLKCCKMINESLGPENTTSDTLITKIMLGVYGNVPAFDTYFKKGFMISSLNKTSLKKIYNFYLKNVDVIDNQLINTLDIVTGLPTTRKYPRAKIIDMIFFIEGLKNSNNNNAPTRTHKIKEPMIDIQSNSTTIPEKIVYSVASIVRSELNKKFTREDVKLAAGISSDVWNSSYNPTFQGMRIDQPGGVTSVNVKYKKVFQRVARGVYMLTDEGKEIIKKIT
ncbi:MAG: hypothetical protein P4L79_06285 [Legionella sp.]|uniref:hypothetical protein n=1 Tax=Legionella sp. TaxID=459 RepID=UPI002847F6B5|nr:hypothetical protein [Legionella sp.]